jgi:hypothetical protein
MLNRAAPSFFNGKATSERPFCADCEAPMILTCLEPDRPRFDLRTFACLMCAAIESIVVPVSWSTTSTSTSISTRRRKM